MTLSVAPTFYHSYASASADYPTANITKSNPASRTDPSVSGGAGTFGGTNATKWTLSSGSFISGGTNNFTMAVRLKVTTGAANDTYVQIGVEGSRNATWNIYSGDAGSKQFRIISTNSGAQTDTGGNATYTNGTYAVWVFRMSSSVGTFWKDGSSIALGNDDFTGIYGSGGLTATPYQVITLGSNSDNSGPCIGVIDWVAVWNAAITDADITNEMTEASIAASLSGGTSHGGALVVQRRRRIIGPQSFGRR